MDDHAFMETEEEDIPGDQFEDEDEDDDEEFEELNPSETTSPSSNADGLVDASIECEGKPVNEGKKEMKKGSEVDVCSICFEAWTSGGDHRICCLPCGHIYGMSCIRKWLIWCHGDWKCPHCKRLCTLKDIRVLYATRLCIADEKPHEASTTNLPYTREGFSEYQQYLSSSMDELKQRLDTLERRADEVDSRLHVLEQTCNELRGLVRANSQ